MCTARPAYDPDLPPRDQELVDFIENHVKNRDDALRLQDNSTKWSENVYIKLMDLANKCTKDNKRYRPYMKEVGM